MKMTYDSFAGPAAILAGVAGFVYSVAFVLQSTALAGLCMLVAGFFTSASLVAVYGNVSALSPTWGQRGVIMAVTGAAGAIIHGGYDLANALHPPTNDPVAAANLPSQVDPRGLLTFFMLGLGVGVLAWLMQRSGSFPVVLVYLSYALAGLLMLTYVARLLILDATNPLVLVPALLTGFLVSPAWFIWLGLVMLRARAAAQAAG